MDIIKICHALGNETRYLIVQSMRNKTIETCCDQIEFFENGVSVGDVVKMAGLAQSTVSQHLRVLENAGIIKREKRGVWTCFFLNELLLQECLHKMAGDLCPDCFL